MYETAPSYEEWRDAMLRIIGETEYFSSLRAKSNRGPVSSREFTGSNEAETHLWYDYGSELHAWIKRCDESLSHATRLQWLAALCRESGRHAQDRVCAEEFAILIDFLVNAVYCGWSRGLLRTDCREEALETIRSFSVLYREFFGPIVGKDLPREPGEPDDCYTMVHHICSMLWDISPLGLLEECLRDEERKLIAEVLDLPWPYCHYGALQGIYCYNEDQAFREMAWAYIRREPRPSPRLLETARWAAGIDE